MRVLLISHTYLVRINQRKLEELAALPGVELRVIVPCVLRKTMHTNIPVEMPECPAYSFLPLPTVLTGWLGRYVHRSLGYHARISLGYRA